RARPAARVHRPRLPGHADPVGARLPLDHQGPAAGHDRGLRSLGRRRAHLVLHLRDPAPAAARAGGGGTAMTILVGLPRDERARTAIHLGVMIARSLDEDLLVCTVVPPPWPPGMARIDAEYQAYLDRSAQEAIDEARTVVPDDRPASFAVRRAGSTAAGLLDVAAEHGARLLVLGSSTAGVLGRVAFGSVADRLLHSSPIPVVLGPRGFRCRDGAVVRRVTVAYGATEGADELVVAVAGVAARA